MDLPAGGLEFLPGQAVMVGAHGQDRRRPHSIACSPERAAETRRLELLIAVDASADPGTNLASAIPGTLVDVEGPAGAFTLPEMSRDRRELCVAGGTGIAPLRSMLDHLLRRAAAPRNSLLYSVRRGDEFAFIAEIARACRRRAARVAPDGHARPKPYLGLACAGASADRISKLCCTSRRRRSALSVGQNRW